MAAAKIVPLQQMIVTAKNQFAGRNNCRMSVSCENFPDRPLNQAPLQCRQLPSRCSILQIGV